MLKHLGWLLNLAAVAAVAWGAWSGFQTYEGALSSAHQRMQARFNVCSQSMGQDSPDQPDQINLMSGCSEALDEDRWVPVFAPDLSPDAFAAAGVPMGLGLVLALVALVLPSRWRMAPARRPRPRAVILG